MKKITYILLIILLIFWCAFSVGAENELTISHIESNISEELFSSLNDEVQDALSFFGIDGLDYERIYDVSFKDVFSYFTPQLKEKAASVLKSFFKLLSAVMILSVVSVMLKESGLEKTVFLLGVMLIILMCTKSMNSTLNSCLSVLKISSSFMVSFVPVLTLIVSLSGNPASAMTYNTFVMAFSEIISAVINYGLVDIVGCFYCLSVSFSLNETMNVNRLINAVNKCVSFFLSLSGSLFAGALTIKNIMSVSVDSLSVKGIRFLISSLIPIIGSTISEAYSSLVGSISLIKGSVAIIGIIAVAIINLPVVIETLFYHLSFSLLSYFSEISGCNEISVFFKAVCCMVRTLLLLVIFEMFILIISTGIMLTFKGGT